MCDGLGQDQIEDRRTSHWWQQIAYATRRAGSHSFACYGAFPSTQELIGMQLRTSLHVSEILLLSLMNLLIASNEMTVSLLNGSLRASANFQPHTWGLAYYSSLLLLNMKRPRLVW